MSAPVDASKTRSDGDETHWWIAYAAHSAVDGTARRVGSADAVDAAAPPRGDAPKLASERRDRQSSVGG